MNACILPCGFYSNLMIWNLSPPPLSWESESRCSPLPALCCVLSITLPLPGFLKGIFFNMWMFKRWKCKIQIALGMPTPIPSMEWADLYPFITVAKALCQICPVLENLSISNYPLVHLRWDDIFSSWFWMSNIFVHIGCIWFFCKNHLEWMKKLWIKVFGYVDLLINVNAFISISTLNIRHNFG